MLARTAALALAVVLARPAAAVDVQGVKVPDSITLDGKELVHNGSGVRKKFIVKVYVGSLFLPQRSKDADSIIAADEVRSVRLVFMRDVSKSQVMDAFREGFRNNSPADADKLAPRLEELAKAIPGTLKEKALLTFDYVPAKGTTVTVEGGPPPVTVEGKDFNDALLRNWIGAKPADADVRKRMLGG